MVVPPTPTQTIPGFVVNQLCESAVELGFSSILWQAENERFAKVMFELGFEPADTLYVLHRDIKTPLKPSFLPPWVSITRAKGYSYSDLEKIDHRCFEPFWQQDPLMMEDARTSTPRASLKLAIDTRGPEDTLVGFSLFGLGSHAAYLQRLAVDPDIWGNGIGSELVRRGLNWARRWRAQAVSVNTQSSNQRALSLYQKLGFVLQPEMLWILKKSCTN
ncbi:MAG: GNAT family N-acetyltransferase [Acidimicrobiaceae bacterium]|nr:GNAT family N-acetyltransferase [Acidimicrobiaceae bacterium]